MCLDARSDACDYLRRRARRASCRRAATPELISRSRRIPAPPVANIAGGRRSDKPNRRQAVFVVDQAQPRRSGSRQNEVAFVGSNLDIFPKLHRFGNRCSTIRPRENARRRPTISLPVAPRARRQCCSAHRPSVAIRRQWRSPPLHLADGLRPGRQADSPNFREGW